MWTDEQFQQRANGRWPEYTSKYAWGFSQQPQRDQEVRVGLKMYRAASSGRLMLLLGDAKIRTDKDLVMNFGFASGSGSDDQDLVSNLDAQRKTIAKKTSAPAISVSGSGSILSDKKWTPLVNDSFILGGTHRRGEFHLALQDFETFDQELQNKRHLFGAVAPQYATPVQSPEHYQQKWKIYLIANPEILWNGAINCPRVFARELIGLMAYGYSPDFNKFEIGFRPSSGGGGADFMRYLKALDQAGFPSKNKARILSSVSEFLFGNAEALN